MLRLLDVNVLIAAADPGHQFHADFRRWYTQAGRPPLATCPLTENGFLRIYGRPDYAGGPGSPANALVPLRVLRNQPGYRFLSDDFSLADATSLVRLDRAAPKQLTDLYLLALAVRHGGMFTTFDSRVPPSSVAGGGKALELLPTSPT